MRRLKPFTAKQWTYSVGRLEKSTSIMRGL